MPSNKLRASLITSGGPGPGIPAGGPLEARSPQGFVLLICEEEPPELVRLQGRTGCWSLGPGDRAGRARLRGSLHRDWELGPKARERPGWNADTNCSAAPSQHQKLQPSGWDEETHSAHPLSFHGVSGGPHPSPLCLSHALDRMGRWCMWCLQHPEGLGTRRREQTGDVICSS